MSRTRVWTIGTALAACLVLSACGDDDPAPDSSSTPSSTATADPTEPAPTATQTGVPQTASDLVGTWRDDTADWTARFAADGTFTWDYQGVTDFLTGTYTLEDGVVTFAGLDGNDLVGEVTPAGLVFDLGTLTPR